MTPTASPLDPYCGRQASDIPEYQNLAAEEGTTPDVEARNDATYNVDSNEFCCTECYVKLGTPSGPQGWKAGQPTR